jgi:hypothetical protein
MIEEHDIEHAAQLGTARHHLETHLKALAEIHEKKQVRWITVNCEQVPEGLWQSSTSTVLLYDCGTGGPVAFVNEYFDHVPYD